MVFRSLVRLTQGGPSHKIPGMARAERKGHVPMLLLYGSNIVGGIVCSLYILRCLFVRDRGLTAHSKISDLDNPYRLQVFTNHQGEDKTYTPPPSKPNIGVNQLVMVPRTQPDFGDEEH